MGSALGRPEEPVLSEGDIEDLIPGFWVPSPHPGFPTTNNLHAVKVEGDLDPERLRKALVELQARHPRLRAKFYENPWTQMNYLVQTDACIPLTIWEGQASDVHRHLEDALRVEFNYETGPMVQAVYVRCGASSVLALVGTHGVSDGRGLEIALAHVLKLYDGQAVPSFHNTSSLTQLHAGYEDAVDAEKVRAWRRVEREFMPDARTAFTETFVEPLAASFKPEFDGVCIEIGRLDPAQTKAPRARSARQLDGTEGGGHRFAESLGAKKLGIAGIF
jgi:hypothetical protein